MNFQFKSLISLSKENRCSNENSRSNENTNIDGTQ